MSNLDYENADGGVLDYEVANGLQNTGNQFDEDFMQTGDTNMSFAEGDPTTTDREFFGADGIDYENLGSNQDLLAINDDNFYSNAGGKRATKRRATRRKSGAISKFLENQREKNRLKFGAKQTLAEAQKESAKAMQMGTKSDAELAKALGKGGTPKKEKGLSMGAKIGIGVGVAVVLGIVGFVIYKKMKNKGK